MYLGLTSLPPTILPEDVGLAHSQVLIARLRIRLGLIVRGSEAVSRDFLIGIRFGDKVTISSVPNLDERK